MGHLIRRTSNPAEMARLARLANKEFHYSTHIWQPGEAKISFHQKLIVSDLVRLNGDFVVF